MTEARPHSRAAGEGERAPNPPVADPMPRRAYRARPALHFGADRLEDLDHAPDVPQRGHVGQLLGGGGGDWRGPQKKMIICV